MAYLGAIDWLSLTLFSAFVLVAAMFGLSLSGHFPAEQQKPEMRAWHGRLLQVVCILAVALGTANAIGLAGRTLPVPVAIIGGGAALLAAPLALQKFPDRFVDGRSGLATLAAVAAGLMYAASLIRA